MFLSPLREFVKFGDLPRRTNRVNGTSIGLTLMREDGAVRHHSMWVWPTHTSSTEFRIALHRDRKTATAHEQVAATRPWVASVEMSRVHELQHAKVKAGPGSSQPEVRDAAANTDRAAKTDARRVPVFPVGVAGLLLLAKPALPHYCVTRPVVRSQQVSLCGCGWTRRTFPGGSPPTAQSGIWGS